MPASPSGARLGAALLVLAMLAGLVAAGWYALSALSQVTESVRSLHSDRVIPLVQLRVVGDGFPRDVQDALRGVMQRRLPAHQAQQRIAAAREAARLHWQAYLGTQLADEEKRWTEWTAPVLERAFAICVQAEEALDRGRMDELARLESDPLRRVFTELAGLIDGLVLVQQRVAGAELRATVAAHREGSYRSLVALTAAFLCATAAVVLLAGQELRRRGRGAQRLRRLNDLYAALSRTNQGVLRLRDEQPLLDELCRICVDTGHALFAVVMRLDADGRPRVAACAGPAPAVALARQGMAEVAASRGTRTYRALYDGESSFVQDYAATPHVVSNWRQQTLALGVRGIAALPIRVDAAPHASLSVFVAEQHFFDFEVRALLAEVAADVAFALQTMRREVERQEAMREVQAAAARLQDVFNGMALPAAILSIVDARVQDINGAFGEMYGLPRELALGRTLADCGVRLPDEAQREGFYRQLREGRAFRNFEARVARPGGDERVILISAAPVRFREQACVIVTSLDITERKQHETALHEREARLAALLDSAGDAIVTLDGALDAVVFNRAAVHLFGLSAGEALGRPLLELICPPERLAGRKRDLQRLLHQGGQLQIEQARFLHADGRPLIVLTTCSTSGEGEQRLVTLLMRDLSAEREAEQARERQQAAEAANRAKTEFLSRMSHELRTPLNAVLGFSQLLQTAASPALTADQALQVGAIRDAGWHLLALINDVLDVSRIESGHLQLDTTDVELGPLIDEVLEMMSAGAQAQGVTLVAAYRERPALAATGDRLRLRQALINLVANAVKYNRPQGRTVLDHELRGNEVLLTVQDSGIGMDKQQLAHLFEPFNRLGREKSGIEGTGVGLALTQQLVQLMHGRVEVRSREGEGTTVSVWLPARMAGSARAVAPAPVAAVAHDSGLRGRVLYAEDNAVNMLIVQQLLARWPEVELLCADSGREALALARSARPDLLLLDMTLGDMDGLAVLDALHADPSTQALKVVILSASAMPESVAEALRHGAREYWTKPIDFDRFLEGMRRQLAPAPL